MLFKHAKALAYIVGPVKVKKLERWGRGGKKRGFVLGKNRSFKGWHRRDLLKAEQRTLHPAVGKGTRKMKKGR